VPILLTVAEVEELVTPEACVEALAEAYRELGEGKAAFRPRSDLWSATGKPGGLYRLRTMEGVSEALGLSSIRIGSDLVEYRREGTATLQRHVPGAPGARYVGLVLVFDLATSELLMVTPDGGLSPLRVGSTSALAARFLAPRGSQTLALLGAGNQARGHLRAYASQFPLREVRVHARRPESARRFAEAMADEVTPDLRPVDDLEAAVDGADIVVCATNSLSPVLPPGLIRPGTFVSCIEWDELADATYERFDRVAVHLHDGTVRNHVAGVEPGVIEGLHRHEMGGWKDALPELSALVAGTATGRVSADETTCFVNNVGSGLQFTAVAKVLFDEARARGVGRELPSDWFSQELPS
jgi:ornithine cyclodeaminase/alanine dehydrogenase-like protein (mu-crystallin family)